MVTLQYCRYASCGMSFWGESFVLSLLTALQNLLVEKPRGAQSAEPTEAVGVCCWEIGCKLVFHPNAFLGMSQVTRYLCPHHHVSFLEPQNVTLCGNGEMGNRGPSAKPLG